MYYPDLENYRFEDKENCDLKNIGWLDITHDFVQGDVDKKLLEKLHFLTCQMDEQPSHSLGRKQKRNITKPVLMIHTNFMRMFPYKCPFCHTAIQLKNLKGKDIQLGTNEMLIPSIMGDYLYNFPTLLYHYISEHQYLPPTEFLQSLQEFDLTKDFYPTEFLTQIHNKKIKRNKIESQTFYYWCR